MLHVPWLHIKYTLIVVKSILVYITCIGIPQKVTKLQLHLRLNEHKGLLLDEKLEKLVNMEGFTM
jgi:hypothetical protein